MAWNTGNKRLGMLWEREFCEMLAGRGFWVHFIAPDARGAQPFDVVAVKNKIAYAFDCKTSCTDIFSFDRLEHNQVMAFEKWIKAGNTEPYIAVKYCDNIYLIKYSELKYMHKCRLDTAYLWRGAF